jgi:hypothetical protein
VLRPPRQQGDLAVGRQCHASLLASGTWRLSRHSTGRGSRILPFITTTTTLGAQLVVAGVLAVNTLKFIARYTSFGFTSWDL